VNALEKELALKEAKLTSLQQQRQHGEGGTGRGDDWGEGRADRDQLESSLADFSSQFAHEVSKMRSWLGTNGCAPVCRHRSIQFVNIFLISLCHAHNLLMFF
jgi:hypothetical protein